MSHLLEKLFEMYTQDFDIVWEKDTDPIDLFCLQHTAQQQTQLLSEMKDLYQDVLSGQKTLRDIINMGLEYVPDVRSPELWLPPLIKHLEKKITGAP